VVYPSFIGDFPNFVKKTPKTYWIAQINSLLFIHGQLSRPDKKGASK